MNGKTQLVRDTAIREAVGMLRARGTPAQLTCPNTFRDPSGADKESHVRYPGRYPTRAIAFAAVTWIGREKPSDIFYIVRGCQYGDDDPITGAVQRDQRSL